MRSFSFCLSFAFELSMLEMIDESAPVANENEITPIIMRMMQSALVSAR